MKGVGRANLIIVIAVRSTPKELEIEEESAAVPATGVSMRVDTASSAESQLHNTASSGMGLHEVRRDTCTSLVVIMMFM